MLQLGTSSQNLCVCVPLIDLTVVNALWGISSESQCVIINFFGVCVCFIDL